MDIGQICRADKPAPIARGWRNVDVPAKRAQLATLRFQTFIARCQLAKAHNDGQRELLAGRLDLIDTRVAHIAARLLEAAR